MLSVNGRKGFLWVYWLNLFIRYQNIHNGCKPFECDQIDKPMSLKITFVNHQRIYSGEMRYECYQCDARFSQRSYLVSHQRTHTGEKAHNVFCVVNILHLNVIL